jgi:hypothetical protein
VPKGSFDLRAWALIGASQRLRELDQERAAILSAFPQLRSGDSPFPRRRGRAKSEKAELGLSARKRKRKKMSKQAREKIAAAQRARWARQKKAKA